MLTGPPPKFHETRDTLDTSTPLDFADQSRRAPTAAGQIKKDAKVIWWLDVKHHGGWVLVGVVVADGENRSSSLVGGYHFDRAACRVCHSRPYRTPSGEDLRCPRRIRRHVSSI